jgi:hypothetical protein
MNGINARQANAKDDRDEGHKFCSAILVGGIEEKNGKEDGEEGRRGSNDLMKLGCSVNTSVKSSENQHLPEQ